MEEVKYESKITKSTASIEAIYAILSDLSNIDRIKHLIPQDRIREIEATPDYVRFKVDGLGKKLYLRIVDREPQKTIKFHVEDAPSDANMWIQMKQLEEHDTRLKLTIKTDMNIMLRKMLEKKLKEGLDKAADMLAQLPFDEWAQNS